MLHLQDETVSSLLFNGNFGLEKEMLRVTGEGRMAHTPHPFAENEPNITRDFCENQTEINTPVCKSPEGVMGQVRLITRRIRERLDGLSPREWLWQYSNPPYIEQENDIPIARFHGSRSQKTEYRHHLARRYGRQMMALSGIHFNYSFAGDLLRRNYEVETGIHIEKGKETADYQAHADRLYLELAERATAYGWVMVALTAASPLVDRSFFEAGQRGGSVFSGMASIRCSELGYWNAFTPVLDYRDTEHYVESIRRYVDQGLLAAPTELYYPIRLKPRGENRLDALRDHGINHIELRMIDVNPLRPEGIDFHDVVFAQLFLLWLISRPGKRLSPVDQLTAVTNFKHAARYDLHMTGILTEEGQRLSLREALLDVLQQMEEFFRGLGRESQVSVTLKYQRDKVLCPGDHRYADLVRHRYSQALVDGLLSDFT